MKLISRAILIAAASLVLAAPSFAAKNASKGSARQAAANSSDVDAVEQAYHSLTDLTARFVQTTEVALVERTVVKKGTFQFKKGGKLRIAYDGKGGKVYVSDGTTLWVHVPGDEASLQTFRVSDETVPREALSFLGGFGKLKKEFEVSSSDAFPEARPGTLALRLVPLAGRKHYESLDALFGPDRLLSELVVKNASGNVSRYVFSEVKTNSGLPDKLFTLSSGKATPDTLPE